MSEGMASMSIEVLGDRIITSVTLSNGKQLCFVSDEKSMVKQMLMYRAALAHLRGVGDAELMEKLVFNGEEEATEGQQEESGTHSNTDTG